MQTDAVLAFFELFSKEEHLWHMQISDAGHMHRTTTPLVVVTELVYCLPCLSLSGNTPIMMLWPDQSVLLHDELHYLNNVSHSSAS